MKPLFVLAHGAGAGQSHPFMRRWQRDLATLGHVVPFEYDYMAAGRKPPDRMPKLLARHRRALEEAVAEHPGAPVVLIGKSMGSRVGCHLANEADLPAPIAGLVCLGYPLQGSKNLRDEVLLALRTPILFVQGTRDRLCPLDLLETVRAKMSAPHALHVVTAGDHSLKLRKRDLKELETTQEASDATAFEAVAAWVRALE